MTHRTRTDWPLKAGTSRRPEISFRIGDVVRAGTHVGTVTDVGTVLVQVKTNEGTSRVLCPWELVRVESAHEDISATSHRSERQSRR
jgi:hypothetical protein